MKGKNAVEHFLTGAFKIEWYNPNRTYITITNTEMFDTDRKKRYVGRLIQKIGDNIKKFNNGYITISPNQKIAIHTNNINKEQITNWLYNNFKREIFIN